MALTEDIRERALAYLKGDLTLSEFEDWLIEESWDAHLHDPLGATLAYTVKLLLAEYTSGHRSEEDVKRGLVPVAQQGRWIVTKRNEPIVTKPRGPRGFVLQTVS